MTDMEDVRGKLLIDGSRWPMPWPGLFTLERGSWYSLNLGLTGPQSRSGCFGKEKNFFACRDSLDIVPGLSCALGIREYKRYIRGAGTVVEIIIIIIIIIIYLSWSWATCSPVPGSRIQKSLQKSTSIWLLSVRLASGKNFP